jgi:single-strand DNA-binding protein
MSLPILSGVGRLTAVPELRFTPSGTAVCTVQLAFNARKKNEQTGKWEDGDTLFIRGTAFKEHAENIAESLTIGAEVLIRGRLKTDQWNDKTSGEKRSSTVLMIDSIGPSLRWSTAKVAKAERRAGSETAGDSWSSAPAAVVSGAEPPF